MKEIRAFKRRIWDFYRTNGRIFAWRNVDNPYFIMVSEVMLQQTQTNRVEQKYSLFIQQFPHFEALAQASLRDVLLAWQGLGYNRRAKALYESAQRVTNEYDGLMPSSPEELELFPGIGKATAASICAFAFNKPTIFIETNIRAVFIHHFFSQCSSKVDDKEIIPLVEETVDKKDPRNWYYALMDYGVSLKKQYKNPSRKSTHYSKQSRFEGSDRQIRGMILKILTKNKDSMSITDLLATVNGSAKRGERILKQLIRENFIIQEGAMVWIS